MMNWLKNWVLRWQFVQEAFDFTYKAQIEFAINKQRADIMVAAQKDFRVGIGEDIEDRAKELADEKLAALLSIFDPKHIVTFSERTRQVYIGGEIADPARLSNLKAEAQMIMDTNLWQILHETPKKLAQKALFEDDGDSKVVHTKGRAMLYLLSTQENIMSVFLNYNPQTPPK